jgi:CRISPR-associated protein Cas1
MAIKCRSELEPVDSGDAVWRERNEHWASAWARNSSARGKRERTRRPLILCGRGVKFCVDKGSLLIFDGFTHYPQERQTYRYFRGDLDLPPRIIMLDGSGGLSFDVIRWLSDQRVPLIMLDYQGDAISVVGGSGFAMSADKVQWQIETRNDPERRLAFSCELILAKLNTCLATLNGAVPDSAARTAAVAATENAMRRIETGSVGTVDELRMVEAQAAASYFKAWAGLPILWTYRSKHPVPDAWLNIGARGSLGSGKAINNRNAKHPVNAMLNYAYGLLSSQIHIEAVAEGYDPRKGVMHHDRDDKDAFAWVFDMIEPRRAIVDAAVLRFVLGNQFRGTDFTVRSDGVCRLAPQLARALAVSISHG